MAKHRDEVPGKGTDHPQAAAPPSRRQILRGLSLAGLAASSATAAGAPAAAAPAPESADPNRVDYRETDHIRRFYALARD